MESKNILTLTEEENETLKKVLQKELNLLNRWLISFKIESNTPIIEILKNIINKL